MFAEKSIAYELALAGGREALYRACKHRLILLKTVNALLIETGQAVREPGRKSETKLEAMRAMIILCNWKDAQQGERLAQAKGVVRLGEHQIYLSAKTIKRFRKVEKIAILYNVVRPGDLLKCQRTARK